MCDTDIPTTDLNACSLIVFLICISLMTNVYCHLDSLCYETPVQISCPLFSLQIGLSAPFRLLWQELFITGAFPGASLALSWQEGLESRLSGEAAPGSIFALEPLDSHRTTLPFLV